MGRPVSNNYDVVIIGGGPAGSSAGTWLAREGLSVLILEKETFPREHVGESLLPFCYEIFDELGVLEELERTSVRKPGVRFSNAEGTASTTYCFKNLLKGPNHLSFHVHRARFDDQLLRNAEKNGVDVVENARVTSVDLSDPNQALVQYQIEGEKHELKTRFVVDASGQDTFLASKMKTKKKHPDLDRVGLVCHWTGHKMTSELTEGLLQIIYTNPSKKGWIGIQPVGRDRLSVSVVTSFEYFRQQKEALMETEDWKTAFYLQEVNAIPYISGVLSDAKRLMSVNTIGNYSYRVQQKFGRNYALIGDSAGFLDPIFATGVYLAIRSAKMITPAIISLLEEGSLKGQQQLTGAYQHHSGVMKMLETFIGNFYDPGFINLAKVSTGLNMDDPDHRRHQIAFSILHYLMGGDAFEEYERYTEFLRFLRDPKHLDRYAHMVLDNPKNYDQACRPESSKIYPMDDV